MALTQQQRVNAVRIHSFEDISVYLELRGQNSTNTFANIQVYNIPRTE